jgi:hypothetical protein
MLLPSKFSLSSSAAKVNMLLSCEVWDDIASATECGDNAVGLEMATNVSKCSLSGSRALFVLIKLFPVP